MPQYNKHNTQIKKFAGTITNNNNLKNKATNGSR